MPFVSLNAHAASKIVEFVATKLSTQITVSNRGANENFKFILIVANLFNENFFIAET